ncbi:AtpZ/AtpI family protein [Methylomarinum sp. Ch1-1]|uniref:AtpZ/AtpI family protein n=1 Tax=Methylomarinum roseum TaxID=3067653 RepID=A0AAU7NZH8_9GAMM|nr:AtpZ/AtpI family protein [Methylomarinum sp. Ch1-1]MDP4521538.1 AtpZ/AtpI family protein [Methylomarinum sp. Ch1-1]
MNHKHHKEHLLMQIDYRIRRYKKARQEKSSILAQTLFLGTLGLVLVLPIIGGAYLGWWLDSLADGYSMRWTLSLLLLGVLVGVINVYLLVREQD